MTGSRPFTFRLVGFAIFAIVLLVASLNALGAFSLTRTYRLQATFEDASGLLVGSRVTVAGVPVGRVVAIELTEDHRALVTLAVEEHVRLAPEVVASLRARSMLGEKEVALSPAPASGSALEDGGTIAATRSLDDLVSMAATASAALEDFRAVAADLSGLARGLEGFQEKLDLERLTDDLHAVGELARTAQRELDGGLTGSLDTFQQAAGDFRELIQSATQPLERLDALLADAREADTIREVTSTTRALRETLQEARTELTTTSRTLREALVGRDGRSGLTSELESTSGAARTFFDEAGAVAKRLDRVTTNLEGTFRKLDSALDNVSKLTPREIRQILQEEGVKVILLQ